MMQDVFSLMKERLKWEPEPEMQLHVFSADELTESPNGTSHQQQFETVCKTASVFLAVDMKASQKHFLETVKTLQWPAFLVLDSEPVCPPCTTLCPVSYTVGVVWPAVLEKSRQACTYLLVQQKRTNKKTPVSTSVKWEGTVLALLS